jgi:hypothetical protein
MAFLGVTYHGSYSPHLDKQPAFCPTPFASIEDDKFNAAFNAHLLGVESAQARALKV